MPVITWIDGLKGGIQPKRELMPEGPEWCFSHQSTVEAALATKATSIRAKATGLLAVAQARYPGTSTWISMEGPQDGRLLDYTVHLNSERGVVAARSIEFGHTGTGAGGNIAVFQEAGKRYPGQFILHRAAGISHPNMGS